MISIIETAEIKQKVELNADKMPEKLATAAEVVLRSMLFDTGRSPVRPDRSLAREERGSGADDRGKAANSSLSKGRAAAVTTALLAKGIDAGRLATEGFGDTTPVADNTSAEVRA